MSREAEQIGRSDKWNEDGVFLRGPQQGAGLREAGRCARAQWHSLPVHVRHQGQASEQGSQRRACHPRQRGKTSHQIPQIVSN